MSKGSKRRLGDNTQYGINWDKIFLKPKRANPMPDKPCGECKYYEPLHEISKNLSEGWCKVTSPAGMVLSEETCDKWNPKT